MDSEKYKVIPLNTPIYTLADLSVVVPQAEQYVKRIKWFLEQYCNSTPEEVIKNTWVVYDPEDAQSALEIDKYPVHKLTTQPPHSTYKMQAGFKEIETRLCVRMHNDVYLARNDWAESLVNQFNTDFNSQMIGYVQPSGSLGKEGVDEFLLLYPMFKEIYDNLEFSEGEILICGTQYLSAYFMASQTYIMRDIYNSFMKFNDDKMDKEDCLFTLFLSTLGVNITQWDNMGEFIRNMGRHYGDFDEEENPPLVPVTVITDQNRELYPKASFHKMNE